MDELHLALGHAARDRNNGTSQALRAVMRAKSTGEQSVSVGVVQFHSRPSAAGADRARYHIAPDFNIALGVPDDRRLAGRARGCVDARYFLPRNGEHAERIVVTEIRLRGERKLGE